MIQICILGKSPMVPDILPYMLEYSITNINTNDVSLTDKYDGYISCIGSPRSYLTKLHVLDSLNLNSWIDIVMHDTTATIYFDGQGNLIFPSFVSKTAKFGRHCLVMPNATIHHDCMVGPGSNIASNVVLNGGVKLLGSCFIGAGTVIKEETYICENVLIGANSYVNKHITKPGVYFGSPATLRSNNDV